MREESDALDCKDFTMSSVGLRTAVALVLLCSIAVLPAGAANEESGFEMEKRDAIRNRRRNQNRRQRPAYRWEPLLRM